MVSLNLIWKREVHCKIKYVNMFCKLESTTWQLLIHGELTVRNRSKQWNPGALFDFPHKPSFLQLKNQMVILGYFRAEIARGGRD